MKKTLSMLLCLSMLVPLLAACGNPTTSTSESVSAPASVETVTDSTPAPAQPAVDSAEPAASAIAEPDTLNTTNSGAEYSAAGYVLPLFDNALTITYRASLNDSDLMAVDGNYANNHAAQAAEEATGVHVEWTVPNATTASETLQLAIAAGDYEDVIGSASGTYYGTLASGVKNDVFVDLLPYLDTDMPFYKAAIQNASDETKRSLISEEGYLCGIDTITDYGTIANGGGIIRTDYLAAVNKEMPVTYDDLYDVLTAFKSELNIAQPLMLPKSLCAMSNSLCSGLDVNGCFANIPFQMAPWYQVDGTIKFGILEDGYHEYIEMIHQWYEEGLISKDFIEKNDNPAGATYLGVISSGDAGMFFGETDLMAVYIEDGVAENPDFEIACMPEIVKEPGQITHFVNSQSTLAGDMAAVNTHCENIDAVLTWLDYFFSPEGSKFGDLGVEGDSYEVVDGKYQFTDTYLNADMTDKVKPVVFMLNEVPRLGVDAPDTYTLEIQLTAEDIWITNDDGAYVLPSISLTEDESETYSRVYSDISTYIEECLTKFVVGDKDMADWDSFIDTVYEMGMQECIDLYQGALDRYYTIDISAFS